MREIKFRAVYTGEPNEQTLVSINDFTIDKMASWEEHEWEFKDGSTFPANDVEDGDLIYIQFTGLKDKNGKEIYEGDILKVPEGFYGDNAMSTTKEHISVVEHDVCDFDSEGSGFYLGLPDDTRWSDCEIIGNIYENPELLEAS